MILENSADMPTKDTPITFGKGFEKPIDRVQYHEEFMMLAHACNSMADIPEKTPVEKFHDDLYTEVYEETEYFFKQSKFLFHSDFPWINIKKIERRLSTRIAALTLGIDGYNKYIMARLYSKKESDVTNAAFVLSSVDTSNRSIYLDQALKVFADTEEQYLPAFANGLKHGLNPLITERLFFILETVSPSVKLTCLDIIKYRNEFKPESLSTYLFKHDEHLLTVLPITVVSRADKNIIEFLEGIAETLSSPLHEKILWTLFMMNSEKAHELCLKSCKEKPELYPDSIELLAMSGMGTDMDDIKSLCDHQNASVRIAAYKALAVLGFGRSVSFLMQKLTKADEECSAIIGKSLTLITGATPVKEDADTIPDKAPCADSAIWQAWWKENRRPYDVPAQDDMRWRKGKPYSIQLLVDEIGSVENDYSSRLQAWKELIILTGNPIPFEPDWAVDKQLSAIDLLEKRILG